MRSYPRRKTMAAESFTERQEDEIQVLKSVYLDDMTDLREKDTWKVARPPEIKLTLRPQRSMGGEMEDHVLVDMVVKCSCKYPEEIPEIKLKNGKGLSDVHLTGLHKELHTLSRQLAGEVMIWELAQLGQKFLHAHNAPPSKSFYEEMMKNKRKQEEIQEQERQKKMDFIRRKEEKERQQLEFEIHRRQLALKSESKRRKDEIRFSESPDNSPRPMTPPPSDLMSVSPISRDTPMRQRSRTPPSTRGDSTSNNDSSERDNRIVRRRRTSTPKVGHQNSTEEDSRTTQCKLHTGAIVVMAFETKSVHRGKCLGHSVNGSSVYAGMDNNTGELVAISEWVLKWRHVARKATSDRDEDDTETKQYLKQISSIEQEMQSLLRLQHPNLIHYLAIKSLPEPGKIIVHILMEYCGGGSLDWYMNNKYAVPMELLRCYTDQLLEAVDYLHNKAVVHKNIRASSILLDDSGSIRLGDFSIHKRLCELYNSIEDQKTGVRFVDLKPPVIGRGGKKGDIYQIGLLLLSLAQGVQVTDTLPEVPTTLLPEFQDFLAKCLMRDERHRWSASQLLEHDFVRHPIPSSLTQHGATHRSQQQDADNRRTSESDEGEEIPLVKSYEACGVSRLTTEFQVLRSLGQGGFGDVLKVKNKLDARLYAIKRIPLNPRSKQFNKKITREVKLLSRLNHENVVRYYNSWIETSDEPAYSDSSSTETPNTSNLSGSDPTPNTSKRSGSDPKKKSVLPKLRNSLDMTDNIEDFAPQRADVSLDWSTSVDHNKTEGQDNDSDDDDDDDDDETDVFGASFFPQSDSSDGVVFEQTSGGTSKFGDWSDGEESRAKETKSENLGLPEEIPKIQYLYIQMEYCEKSTLRNCVDAGLYEDVHRVWRLFREIVEGLAHIHEQGMIHRDLKPVNIFLDSNDHVKIGDFGLATTDAIVKQGGLVDLTMLSLSAGEIPFSSSMSGTSNDGNLTGKVGTMLYASPEIMAGGNKAIYNQKVDIYSLGIIFFEMCYRALGTGMERATLLINLRKPAIPLPEDFDELELGNQTQIIRWLLNHDPIQRPTSQELLQSDYLPPPQMEEAELTEVLRSTISNPQSKAYRHMIGALLSQPVSPAIDLTYDMDARKASFSQRVSLCHHQVSELLVRVFQRHGAVQVSTPLFIPRCKLFDNNDQQVLLVDHSGGVVGLQYDLRVPFARYIARNNVTFMKRYHINHVYREKKPFGLHPKELIECAFDIITSTPGNLIPDAEVLYIVQEIISESPALQNRNFYVRINHTSLLHAILLHCGIAEDKHEEVLSLLQGVLHEKQKKGQVLKMLCKLPLLEHQASMIMTLLETEGPCGKVASILRLITKTKGPAGSLAKQGLHEVEAILTHATTLGMKMKVILTLGLSLNIQQYSGVMFQVLTDVKRKKRIVADIWAAGGRYNNMISQFQAPVLSQVMAPTVQHGVGVSISFEKITTAIMDHSEFQPPSPSDILICTIGHKPMLKERLALVKDLWSAGLRAEVIYETVQSLEEIQDLCRRLNIPHLVILKDSDTGSIKVRSAEKDKITEKKVNISELADFLQQKINSGRVETPGDASQSSGVKTNVISSSQSSGESIHIQPTTGAGGGGNNFPAFNFTFFIQDSTKLAQNTKKKHEVQIFAKLMSHFSWLSGKYVTEVIAIELTAPALRIISAYLDLGGTEATFQESITSVMEKLTRHRKFLTRIFDHIHDLKFINGKRCVMILYGLKDDSFKLLS